MEVEIRQIAIELENGVILRNINYENKRYTITLVSGKIIKDKPIIDIFDKEIVVAMPNTERRIKFKDIKDIERTQ